MMLDTTYKQFEYLPKFKFYYLPSLYQSKLYLKFEFQISKTE